MVPIIEPLKKKSSRMDLSSCFKLDRKQALPLYQQLIDGLSRVCRELPAGTKLPNERELSATLGCSRNILRQAMEYMVAQGFLERRRANGTFVAARNRGRKLLVVLPDENDISQSWQYIMPGIETRAMELGIALVKISISFLRSGDPAEKQIFLRGQQLNGVIILGAAYVGTEPEIAFFQEAGLPVVLPMGRDVDTITTPFFVMADVIRPAFLAGLRHLIRLGHSRIAAIGSNMDDSGIRGFSHRECSRYFNCPENELLIWHAEYSDAAIDETIQAILALPEMPSALICCSDFFAIKALEALHKRGVRVPEDISMMGFCGYPGGAFLTPALTTVSLEYEPCGRAAVDFLINSDLSISNLPKNTFRLIERASVRSIK